MTQSRRDRWAQQVVHRDVTVLSVREPGVLDEIRAVVPLDEFVLAVISDTRLLLDPTRLAELHGLLTAAGVAPLMQRARDDL
ncbi:MAG: hypothetical protein CL927_06760 [Deltaproteobacteria bacterium]|nr:hypothetical protein [Deltaproteobacteria bacterium]